MGYVFDAATSDPLANAARAGAHSFPRAHDPRLPDRVVHDRLCDPYANTGMLPSSATRGVHGAGHLPLLGRGCLHRWPL